MLPNLLAHAAHGTGIAVTCKPRDVDAHGVVVDLSFDGADDAGEQLLAGWLAEMNRRIPGLNLVAEEAPAPDNAA